EGAVGKRDAGVLRLGADGADELAVDARALVAGATDLTAVVRCEERADHELAGLDVRDVGADIFDDAYVLVSHRRRPVDGLDAAVGPQVGPADTRGRETDDGVGRLLDLG